MPIYLALFLLAALYFIYKMFVSGWLFRIILFIFGWFGLYMAVFIAAGGKPSSPMIIDGSPISWAVIIPTAVCLLALLTFKIEK